MPDITMHPLRRRKTGFDGSLAHAPRIPGDPFSVHFVRAILVLRSPAFGQWFRHVFRRTPPRLDDDVPRAEIKGFVAREGTHAHTPALQRVWQRTRVAIIAALEHRTCVLGNCPLHADLESIGADSTMVDRLRRHGAKEIEPGTADADVFDARGHHCPPRAATMRLAAPGFVALRIGGTRAPARRDPHREPRSRTWRAIFHYDGRAGRQGRLPSPRYLIDAFARPLAPCRDAGHEGSTRQAIAYLLRGDADAAAMRMANTNLNPKHERDADASRTR
ncbi:metal-dependent hydrolase [Burkholderia thailandensis]|nr:metal-dependent hydrolase [Burkholderia thailandensis]MCS3392865.1 metal-dependent hydrolase [Burkholderia thailandensis]MCS6453313.1 metal-dependent hydrolase [Burkholderia thailandensis]MCS6482535.1 metal-dependent hydrolase [Burkholderia thailandensis]MCS6489484.1 metal-dependent hydrolase [Burkholderia thailandensis]MCZ2899006.1 metal-dependent hydrolase [Burkholderia thailandensis]